MARADTQPVSRPGGRTARTRAAVRDATQAELAEHGYPGLTVEGVAARSGVHKTTVYRRWGGVDGLIVDALALADEDEWAPPDTGSFEEDLVGLAVEVWETFASPTRGAAPRAFIAAAFHSPQAAAALHTFFAERHRRSAEVVTRAAARADVAAETDAEAVVRAVVAPLYLALLDSSVWPSKESAVRSAVAVAHAARAGIYAADMTRGPGGN